MTSTRIGLIVPVLFVALAATAGCNLQGGQSECVVGTAGCSCVHGDACDPGLSCQAGTCLGPGGAGISGEPAPAGGPPLTSEVLVRFCHDMATVPEGQPFELQLGSARLTAATGQCSQPAGQACVAVPPGKVPVKLKLAGQVKDFGTRELAGGKAYLFELDQAKLGEEVVAIPRAVELESQQECSRLDFKQSRLRTDAPLELEPFAADGFSFARPKGFVRKGNQPFVYRFEAPAPGQSNISSFQISYLGHLPFGQDPRPLDMVERRLAERKLTVVSAAAGNDYYASGVGDTGVPGADRYVLLAEHKHWDLEDEERLGGTRGVGYDVFSVEMTFGDLTAVDVHALRFVAKSIAWGLSVPASEVPRGELAGTWASDGFELKLSPGGIYDLRTGFGYGCLDLEPTTICPTAVIMYTFSHGRYEVGPGNIVFHPSRCDLQRTEDGRLAYKGERCPRDRIPVTLSMERAASGAIRFGGLGSGVQIAYLQQLWQARRKDGLPGSWTVPDMPPARPHFGGLWGPSNNICGAVEEVEPNNKEEQATVLTPGKTLNACIPRSGYDEYDWYDVTAPIGGAPGFFVLSLKDTGIGKVPLEIELTGSARTETGSTAFFFPERNTQTPGKPMFTVWTASPGQRFQFRVRNPGNGWFRYAVNLTFTEVKDPSAPNHTEATARPLTLGTPAQAYFFGTKQGSGSLLQGGEDYYVVDLAPGPVTVKIEDVATNVVVSASLQDMKDYGRRTLFTTTGRNPALKEGESLIATGEVLVAGKYRLYVGGFRSWYYQSEAGEVPESYTKPYRLLVTQP